MSTITKPAGLNDVLFLFGDGSESWPVADPMPFWARIVKFRSTQPISNEKARPGRKSRQPGAASQKKEQD
jgi:hypothetical protein